MKPKSHQLINQDSGNTEYYTCLKIVEAAREVMGGIDLDPASSIAANQKIKAKTYYSEGQNGLNYSWTGNVWLNHPFSRKNNRIWIRKLVADFQRMYIFQFCSITFAATSENWFRPLHQFPQCYLYPRTNYYLPDGSLKKGVTKGSVVTYGGPNIAKFIEVFKKFGAVKMPGDLYGAE